MLAIEVNGAGAFGGKNIDTELEKLHLDGRGVRFALSAFDCSDQMPHALLVHLRGRNLNALVSDVINATTKALLAEFFFNIDAGRLQVKGFALCAGGSLRHALVRLIPVGADADVRHQRHTQRRDACHFLSEFNPDLS